MEAEAEAEAQFEIQMEAEAEAFKKFGANLEAEAEVARFWKLQLEAEAEVLSKSSASASLARIDDGNSPSISAKFASSESSCRSLDLRERKKIVVF